MIGFPRLSELSMKVGNNFILAFALATLTLSGYATPQRLAPEPAASMTEANTGVSNVRFLVARDPASFQDEALGALAKEKAWQAANGDPREVPTAYFLPRPSVGENG